VHISADDAHADDAAAALGFAALATNRLFAPDALLPPGRARRGAAKKPTVAGPEPASRAHSGSGSNSTKGSPLKRVAKRAQGDAAAAAADAREKAATPVPTLIAPAPVGPLAAAEAKPATSAPERPRVSALKGPNRKMKRGEASTAASGSQELRDRLRCFYERCSPEKLGNIDLIIERCAVDAPQQPQRTR
jgi:hypothetical protein